MAAGATGMTSVAGGGLIMSAHLPLDVAVLAVGAGFLFTEQFFRSTWSSAAKRTHSPLPGFRC